MILHHSDRYEHYARALRRFYSAVSASQTSSYDHSDAIRLVTVHQRPFETVSLRQLVYEVILHPEAVSFLDDGVG